MKKIFLLIILVFAVFGSVNAENSGAYKGKKFVNEKVLNSYLDFSFVFPMDETSSEKFLKKYGQICDIASDSVNIFMIKDGKFLGSTRVGYPENFKPVYSCVSFKGAVLDFEIREKFEKSLENLTLEEMKKINSVLKKFYENEKDFFKNLEKTVKLVERIEKIKQTSRFSSEKPIAILDYINYQIIDLFTKK